jgi:hypothetical protein
LKKLLVFIIILIILFLLAGCRTAQLTPGGNSPVTETVPQSSSSINNATPDISSPPISELPIITSISPSPTRPSITASQTPKWHFSLPIHGDLYNTINSDEIEIPAEDSLLSGGEIVKGIPGSPSIIAFDKDNVVWMGVNRIANISRGFDSFNGVVACHHNRFQIFDGYNTRGLRGKMTAIFVDKQNIKWFGNEWGEIFTYDNRQWKKLPTPEGNNTIMGIQQDTSGKIWVAGVNRDNGQSHIWNYDSGILGQVKPGYGDIRRFIIDSEDKFWISTPSLVKDIPLRSVPFQSGTMNVFTVRNIAYADGSKTLYLALSSSPADVEGPGSGEGGLYCYKDGKLTALSTEKQTGLPFVRSIGQLAIDNEGNVWTGYWNWNLVAAKYDGKEWIPFAEGTPLYGGRCRGIYVDQQNRVWFIVEHRSEPNWPANIGVYVLDGETWTTNPFPMLTWSSRIWWEYKSLKELFELPTEPVDISQVYANPFDYKGKKISFIGKFDNSGLIDQKGNVFKIWPEFHKDCKGFFTEKLSEYHEFVGFLEYGCEYGQTVSGDVVYSGGWQYQLLITEVYPLNVQQKSLCQNLYKEHFINN